MDLSSLASTLAERIWNEAAIIDGGGCTVFQFEKAEALIHEAIDKTIEEAERATCAFCRSGAELVGQQHKLLTSENSMTSYSYTYIDCDAAAIRSRWR